ncbi:hypothetical protein D6789_01480 [Candidatus Woesearchaeota archaeon]|nr:MAG: hypothetical protein D6789_01480 [Candidatus Woesearchaeota archaeon]
MDPQELKRTTLAHCLPENAFHVQRGDVITNIYDLANCIESLSEAEFRQHVDPEGEFNHFADWIRGVLGNPELARDLNYDANLRDKAHYVKTIRDHIAWLESV